MPDDPSPTGQPAPEDGTSGPVSGLVSGGHTRDTQRPRTRRAGVAQLFEALDKQAPEQAKLLTNTLGMKLLLIPAGTLLMGSSVDDEVQRLNETPQHEVSITQPFYMAAHLVTQRQYHEVMRDNPSRFNPSAGGSLEHPVDRASWDDASAFCRRLSELPGEKQAGRSYRLPTEAEWEYACRAGTTTPFCYGAALAAAQANFDGRFPLGGGETGRCIGKTAPIGTYAANNFGLYDMHGNLWEWCADWYDGNYYHHSPRRDPPGPGAGRFRVVRGGSWRNHAATCRAAYRNALVPNNRDPYTGFRVVIGATPAR